MPITLSSLALVLIALVAPVAAAERADKPALRTAVPPSLDAPRAAADKAEPVRVRTGDRAPREKVNINTADATALMTLSGVGRALAEKIVAHRTAHGPFKKPDEIRKVAGFGSGAWERNRQRIVVK
jgi:competence protein ComEA